MGLALSLKQQIGQLLITGFEGTTLSPWVERLIRDRHVGGIILFERNFESPAQLEELIQKMQRIALSSPSAVPLFISVDQEGGRVSRLKSP
ncbi:MAG: glycoside hydrolase family 3 N-terminal domain-containing protein, partial [Nitrospinota bacterium]|nr:glycoside hydrolase family 3 N-terminal domain-containing protein [Nitrospinota bacterium]